VGVAVTCASVGLALSGSALWLILSTTSIPLSQGVAYAAMLAVASVAFIATGWTVLGGSVHALAADGPTRSVWLRTAAAAAALLVGITALGGLSYWLGRDLVERTLHQRLLEVATLERSMIQAWIEGERSDIRVWAAEEVLGQALDVWRGGALEVPVNRQHHRESLKRLAKSWNYAAISLRDPETGERWLTTRDEADDRADRQRAIAVAAETVDPERPVVNPVYADVTPGVPIELTFFYRVSLPGDARRAVIQVDVDLEDALLRHVKRGPSLKGAAEVLLVQREGDVIVVLDGARDSPPRTPQRRFAANAKDSLWFALQQQGNAGLARGNDENGRRALAFALPVSDTRWLLVAKVGESEMVGELNRVFLLAAAMADALLVLSAWWWALYRRQAAVETRLQRERAGHAERVAELSRRVVSTQEEERHRLAMELHDRTAANLAVIQMNLKSISHTMPAADANELQLFQETGELLADTVVSIREFCTELRPVLLDYAGLAPAIRSSAAQFERRTGIATVVDDQDYSIRCTPDVESGLFRIVQEALLNCAKHSKATRVHIRLAVLAGQLRLEIEDNGTGFDPKAVGQGGHDAGHGLLNMRDRAAFAEGVLTIHSQPGQGTRIRFEMPCVVVTNGAGH
jgi:signal transduction histidine kinase